jgi:hypothetical protein
MSFLNRLEKYLSWLTIEHLPIYIVTAQAMVYIWMMVNPSGIQLLLLDPLAVIYGHEYWRLVTFLFITPLSNPIFAFFFLYLLYIYGSALENVWGSFGFTLFYLVGAIGTGIAAFYFGEGAGAFYLNTTIFLAFAALHPNFQLLFFFIIPVKVKWFAVFIWAGLLYQILLSPQQVRMAIVVSLSNYLLFFGKMHVDDTVAFIRRHWLKRSFE